VLLQRLGKQERFLDDLASFDPDLYQGLIFLKHYTGNPEDLSLNLAVAVESAPNVIPSKRVIYAYLSAHIFLRITGSHDPRPHSGCNRHPREPSTVYPARIALSPEQANQTAERGVLRGLIDTKWLDLGSLRTVVPDGDGRIGCSTSKCRF
jgi:hypothetical protein